MNGWILKIGLQTEEQMIKRNINADWAGRTAVYKAGRGDGTRDSLLEVLVLVKGGKPDNPEMKPRCSKNRNSPQLT